MAKDLQDAKRVVISGVHEKEGGSVHIMSGSNVFGESLDAAPALNT